jgi:L-asparaginase
MAELLILITGGTLDKIHDTVSESLVLDAAEGTAVPHVLAQGRACSVRTQVLMQIDSLDMTDVHRQLILDAVRAATESQIVITHGTGTMELTAKALDGNVADKTVVLTGAMRPHSLGRSDAGFNIGGAMIAAQTLPAGVYGVMNGQVFTASHLHKDVTTGRFD